MTTEKTSEQLNEGAKKTPINVRRDHSHILSMWDAGSPEREEAEEELNRLATDHPKLYQRIVGLD